MKATFLGTNGWYDTTTGNTVCILIETEKYDMVLDAGNGIHKLDSYVSGRKPRGRGGRGRVDARVAWRNHV